MIEERSAGAVLFNETDSGKIFLLLNYPAGHWDFVKGNIEDEETLQQTVVREIREETGIADVEFIDGFEDKIEYHYQRDGILVHKEVIFFLAKNNFFVNQNTITLIMIFYFVFKPINKFYIGDACLFSNFSYYCLLKSFFV